MKRVIALSFALVWFLLMGVPTRLSRAFEGDPVTFNNQVVRLLQRNCQVCHHPDDIGPFSFMTYSEAKLFSVIIREAAESRTMPPWFPAPGCGEFDDERHLTDEEIDILTRWVDAGTPEGNPADLPPPLQFNNDWTLGPPDLVLQPEADFNVELGDDIYRYYSFPTDLRGDRFLSAIDVKPGARSVVHHAVLYFDEKGESTLRDDRDPGPGFPSAGDAEFLTQGLTGWWVPGEQARFETEGTGWLLPKGSRVVIKVHYHVHHGGAAKDRTQVGLYFARTPVRKRIHVSPVANTTFVIPAGESDYRLRAESFAIAAGQSAHALGVAAHMQLLGHQMEVTAKGPDGSLRCLLNIEDWDSHWQGLYRFRQPVPLSAGTLLELSASYNNSVSNLENPNYPPKPVRAGDLTTDETCMAFLKYTVDVENREISSPEIKSATIDSSGRLVVKATGLLDGADILVDGKRLADTSNIKKKKVKKGLQSIADWRDLIPPGRQVSITVLNPDGVRSASVTLTR